MATSRELTRRRIASRTHKVCEEDAEGSELGIETLRGVSASIGPVPFERLC